MREELFINDVPMDLDADFKGVQLVYQSPYLTDLKSIVSNRTNTISLPTTLHNLRVIGLADVRQVSTFPYRKHRAIYKRDGVQMLHGTATLLNVTDKAIQVCFTWGNVDAFQKMFDIHLSDLGDLGETYVNLMNLPVTYRSYIMRWGNNQRQMPVVLASEILSRIEQKCGVTGLTNVARFNKMSIPLLSLQGDATTRTMQQLRSNQEINNTDIISSGKDYGVIVPDNFADLTDYHHSWDSALKVIYTNGAQTARIKVKTTNKLDWLYAYDTTPQMTGLYAVVTPIEGDISSGTATIIKSGYVVTSQSDHYYRIDNMDEDVTIQVNGRQYLYLVLGMQQVSGTGYIAIQTHTTMELSIEFDEGMDEEVLYENINNYPLWKNMPEMSCGEFVRNLMLFSGLFAYNDNDTDVKFTSFGDVFANKINAKDWTLKMITAQSKERKTTLDDFAKNNYMRYAQVDDIVDGAYDGVIVCDDDNLQPEATTFQSAFALAPNNLLNAWVFNTDEGTYTFEGDSLGARILYDLSNISVQYPWWAGFKYDEQAWTKIIEKYYAEYQQVVYNPVVIKAEFALNVADLYALDLRVPIYLKQTGRYYAIRKLTTKNLSIAEAELIEL